MLPTLSTLLLLLPFVSPPSLGSMVNHRRVVVVFAPTRTDARLIQQGELMAHHAAELQERDVVIWSNVLHQDSNAPEGTPAFAGVPPTQEELESERARFHLQPNEFTVLLIGKDGGEKLRQHSPISFEQLASAIDAMPMRRDEKKRQQKQTQVSAAKPGAPGFVPD